MPDYGLFTQSNNEEPPNSSGDANEGFEQRLSSQRLYRDLFAHMNEGFAFFRAEFDADGNPTNYIFHFANNAFSRLLGIGDQQLIGKKISELSPAPTKEALVCIKNCGAAALTGRSLAVEKHCTGSNRWFAVNAYCPEKGCFAMLIKDITLRKKAQQELKQSERRYKKLANSIADPFFAVNSSLKVTYWNRTSENYTGLKAGNVLGKHYFEVFGKDKLTRKMVRIYHAVMRGKKPRTVVDTLPKCLKKATFEIHIYPTGNGISVFAKDITERKRLQKSLEDYTKRLEELVRIRSEKLKEVERFVAIGETAGMIGHDIRNPLQSITGELYLAKEELDALPEGDSKENLMASLTAIEEQTAYINKIVTDLQDYAKPLVPAYQEIDMEQAIQDVISNLDIPEEISLSYSITKPFPPFKTDQSYMKRIMTNLTLNGVQAMQEKGSGELSINVFPREKSIIISIADTGPGIPDTVREKLFKPLFTTKSKGQGFGLAVVKKLVDALSGNISFETKVGAGTTFIIELPLQ